MRSRTTARRWDQFAGFRAFNSRGTAHTALDQYDRAILDVDQAARLNPASPIAFRNRCFVKALVRRIEEGLADCNEALRLKPDNPGAAWRRAGPCTCCLGAPTKPSPTAMPTCRSVRRSLFAVLQRPGSLLKGDAPGGDRDIAAARARNPDIETHMAKLGLRLQDFR